MEANQTFDFSSPRRQSRIAIGVILIKFLRQTVKALWPVLISFFITGGRNNSFWEDMIAKQLLKELKASEGPDVIINLASNEYWKAADRKVLKAPVVTIGFREYRGGKPTLISFSAKVARGQMARFMIDGRVDHPEGLKDFDLDGYRFDPDLSSPEDLDLTDHAGRWTWVFSRPDPREAL